jgi:hypothetical protein
MGAELAATSGTDQTSTTPSCFTVSGPAQKLRGAAFLRLTLSFANTTDKIMLSHATLTLTT